MRAQQPLTCRTVGLVGPCRTRDRSRMRSNAKLAGGLRCMHEWRIGCTAMPALTFDERGDDRWFSIWISSPSSLFCFSAIGGAVSIPLVGASTEMTGIERRLDAIARAERTTLISGPTGSGKDVIAHSLHERSRRSGAPMIVVHCAALPDNLIEAELFGHAKGAFTGACQARSGLVRSAEHGSLFLDEIDSLSLGAQAKLLRFPETGEFLAVGADNAERSDAWVIAATNQELRARVRERTFREDLLYRLEGGRIGQPPHWRTRAR